MPSWPWKPLVDGREVPQAISAEPFLIVDGVALLAEAPNDPSDPATPMVVTVDGSPRTRTLGAPAPGQYRVRKWETAPPGPEWLPELEFNAADEGLSGEASYYGTGTIWTARRFQSFQAHLDPLVGVADEAALSALYPPSTNRDDPGRDGRTARLADGSWWESDGVEWKPWVGGGSLSAARSDGATLAASQDGDFLPGQYGADTAAATAAAAQDAAYGVTGADTAASTLGSSPDAVQAEVGAPASQAATLGAAQDAVAVVGSDTFTGTNATAITSHTPDVGAGWTNTNYPTVNAAGDTPIIQGNRVCLPNPTPNQFAFCKKGDTPPAADYDVEVDVVVISTDAWQAGITARETAYNNLYLLKFSTATNKLYLVKYVSGVETYLPDTNGYALSPAPALNDVYRIKLSPRGTTLSAYINKNGAGYGSAVLTVTDTSISLAGAAGFMLYQNTVADARTHGLHLDNFLVTPA